MKTFKEFLEESINISGGTVGTIIIGGNSSAEEVGEEFTADILWRETR
jgi:hypothetical protein